VALSAAVQAVDPYRYISERLVDGVIEHAEALKSGKKLGGLMLNVAGVGGLGITLENTRTGTNRIAAAKAVEVLLHEHTGDLDDPEAPPYVGYRGPVQLWIFTYKEEAPRVIWAAVEHGGSTLLVLCGSARYWRGRSLDLPPENWWPSNAEGMEEVLRESGRLDYHQDDSIQIGVSSVESVAPAAASHTLGLQAQGTQQPQEYDVLCEVYGEARDVVAATSVGGGLSVEWARVLIGAPLWIRDLHANAPPPGSK